MTVFKGEHQVWVDAGVGDIFLKAGRWPGSLGKAEVDLAEIDKVGIAHAHANHIGGLLNEERAPTDPSARVDTLERAWDFCLAMDALEKAPGSEFAIKAAEYAGSWARKMAGDNGFIDGPLVACLGHASLFGVLGTPFRMRKLRFIHSFLMGNDEKR